MTPVVLLAFDSRTSSRFSFLALFCIEPFPSRLSDYGRGEGRPAHDFNRGSHPYTPRPRHRHRPSDQPGAVLANQRHRGIHHSCKELVRPCSCHLQKLDLSMLTSAFSLDRRDALN
jgi:hypothetical protein